MNGPEVVEIAREAIWTIFKMSLPLMLAAMIVGLTIALFQALTQIQEMTLTFIPKIIAVFVGLLFFLPFMSESIQRLSFHIFDMLTKLS